MAPCRMSSAHSTISHLTLFTTLGCISNPILQRRKLGGTQPRLLSWELNPLMHHEHNSSLWPPNSSSFKPESGGRGHGHGGDRHKWHLLVTISTKARDPSPGGGEIHSHAPGLRVSFFSNPEGVIHSVALYSGLTLSLKPNEHTLPI